MNNPEIAFATPTRREALLSFGAGFGALAAASVLHADELKPHHTARAKRCVFLMMEGGPSH